ncbi:extracellular solute-binding protein [Paenibacillus eucommiae]|uniref:Aldouronate transport system substrate-binding protein n=1 Tax=Paenibacillus eucommiae TaxID=1355755 RepID=A0ABS4J015_9BACL|nr:extracellular solute-binding protein [Paenibacillus eucommiae]MBP1993185.1 putative aldouronate transport system substrate-binding protein [Paenibacillus eucommiae]
MKNRVMPIVLSLIMVLTILLAACSSKTADPTTNPTTDLNTVPSTSTNSPGGVKGKYDPPIELTTVMYNFNYPKFGEGDSLNNNPWTRYLLEQDGIKVNHLWDVASAQYEQKVNLMIASGNIPDFFAVSPLQFKQLHNAGLIEDLTHSYEQYATEETKQVIQDAGPEVIQSAIIDGKLMAIPWSGENLVYSPSVLWVRSDWMEQLKLSPPQSMNDVLHIAEAFTKQDPDGNKQDDTFGLAMDKNFDMMTGFLNAYHAYKGIWMEDGAGRLAYSSIQPEMKTALAKLQEMYAARQLDPEFGIKDYAKVEESIGSGKIGLIFGNIGTSELTQRLTPAIDWIPYPVPSIDDKPALMQHPLNIAGYYWVVKKGTKNVEAIYQMIQVWLDLFYNNTSDEMYAQYNATSDTGYWMNAPIRIYKTFKDVDIYRHLKPLLESSDKEHADVSELTPEERDFYARILDFEKGNSDNRWVYWKEGLNSSAKVIDGYITNKQYQPDKFIITPTPAMIQKKPNLDKMENQMISKIILGGSLDEFDKFVSEWKKLGGDDITKEVNDWYANK